jgi:3-deoxy-D-manno-octulosonic-acid transferase
MYLIYSLLLGLGFLLMLPRFVLDAWQHGKYTSGLGQRLGNIEVFDHHRPVIWLHCVSVGEVQAARPLYQALLREFPNHSIAISTVTITGQQLARELFQNQWTRVFYFPIDWRWAVRRVLKKVRPSLVLLMETELWPNFLRECRQDSLPVAIVNGRLSERSFQRWKLVRRFVARVMNCLDCAVMQTEADAARMRALGLKSERVRISGNMKFDAGAPDQTNPVSKDLATRFHLGNNDLVLLAASTHDPEEQIVLEAFIRLKSSADLAKLRLIIAPRHPERFATVAGIINTSGFSWTRRSANPAATDTAVDILLLDSIGELRLLFPLASLVFVGGSIAPIGGHNVLEPAAAGACIVTGPHTKNFAEIIRTFLANDALVQMKAATGDEAVSLLADVCATLLRDPERRRELATRAGDLVEENRGATARTLEILKTIGNANR